MRRLKLRHCIVAWALIGVGLILPLCQKVTASDFWWHLATGRLILRTHTIPVHDPFSFTAAGKEWIAHEWLSEVIFYGVYRLSGLTGIVMLRSLVVFLLAISLYQFVLRRTRDELSSAAAAALLTLVGFPFWGERPQIFSYLLLITLLRLIDRWRRGGSIWVVVPIFALWVNMHGAWIVGLGVLAVVLAEECVHSVRVGKSVRVGHLVAVCAAVIGALYANPIGPKLVTYPFQYFGSNHYTKYIIEWRRTDFHSPELLPYYAALAGLLVLVVMGRGRARASEWIIALGAAAASCYSVRHVPVFAVLVAPLVSTQIKACLDRRPKNRRVSGESPVLSWTALIVLFFVLWTCIPRQSSTSSSMQDGLFPVDAADYLWPREVMGRGRLMTALNWGGYLIYRLYPAYKVSMDGRVDLYGPEGTAANHRLEKAAGRWHKDLAEMNPDLILWPRRWPLAKKLPGMPGWWLIYEDKSSVMYVKSSIPTGENGG